MDRFYTRDQAAKKLGVSLDTLDRARRDGTLRFAVSGYTPLFSEVALLEWKAHYDLVHSGIVSDAQGRKLYSGGAAARYLGITRQGIAWRRTNKTLVPDVVRGKREFFYQETLDAVRKGR